MLNEIIGFKFMILKIFYLLILEVNLFEQNIYALKMKNLLTIKV